MKTQDSLFLTKDYKVYLNAALEEKSQIQRGQRLRLAKYLSCNPSYITQVLNGHQDLSPEQARSVSRFLGHTDDESRYFLNLVLLSRAGTEDLKKYYLQELKKLSTDHQVVLNRLKIKRSLDFTEQANYYKTWYNAAIHLIVSIPQYRTRDRIAKALNLDLKTVNESVEFLLSTGLLKEVKKELQRGEQSLIIGSDSPFLVRHQTNWRLQALQKLDNQIDPNSLHFSGVISCAKNDLPVIKEIILKAIQEIRAVVKESADETLAAYNFDLFRVLDQRDASD